MSATFDVEMNIAILLTGGTGSRMASPLPKQFIKINDKPLFVYPLLTFVNHPEIDRVILVINEEYRKLYEQYLNEYKLNNIKLVRGGATRFDSITSALKYLSTTTKKDDIILIHDGARALVSAKIISDNIVVARNKVAITAINVVDTIAKQDYTIINRDELKIIQTPQSFTYEIISKLHEDNNDNSVTDDGQLAKKYGYDFQFVQGDKANFKVTTSDDIELMKLYLSR